MYTFGLQYYNKHSLPSDSLISLTGSASAQHPANSSAHFYDHEYSVQGCPRRTVLSSTLPPPEVNFSVQQIVPWMGRMLVWVSVVMPHSLSLSLDHILNVICISHCPSLICPLNVHSIPPPSPEYSSACKLNDMFAPNGTGGSSSSIRPNQWANGKTKTKISEQKECLNLHSLNAYYYYYYCLGNRNYNVKLSNTWLTTVTPSRRRRPERSKGEISKHKYILFIAFEK